MTALERSLIEKAGYANGWENVRESTPDRVVMFSARHKAEAHVSPPVAGAGPWQVSFPKGPITSELARSLPDMLCDSGTFHAKGETALGGLLRRAAKLAMALPNQAAEEYAAEAAKIEASPPTTTEAIRLVKQRIGQNLFRQALMHYWGGACAVTGIAIPELLRASHAKPWAKCDTDAERLNVFNGLLLCAHLDALFDQGLLSFSDEGTAVVSNLLDATTLAALNMAGPLSLRWVSPEHGAFLQWHRDHIAKP